MQGLELDWSCVTSDSDFRYVNNDWEHWSFVGDRWNRIKKAERKKYLKNAYRVLLARARQGMVIVVPEGDPKDPTRKPEYYDLRLSTLLELALSVCEPAYRRPHQFKQAAIKTQVLRLGFPPPVTELSILLGSG